VKDEMAAAPLPLVLAGLSVLVLTAASTLSATEDPFIHRRLLRHRSSAAAGDALTTQRWVGAQSQDGVAVSDMSCTFDVPLDSEIGKFPEKGHGEAHYIYCDLHHGWPGKHRCLP
jgi:hypothetical protein